MSRVLDVFFYRPDHFPEPLYNHENNPVTAKGFALGKALFFETRLSSNNTISCGSCHLPAAAFTHPGHDVSHGVEDRLGKRNALPIMNLAWSRDFMWDGGVFNLDLQPIVPITAHEEMNETIPGVIAKLQQTATYPAMFREAFGSEDITPSKLYKALSQFMISSISAGSKFDSVVYYQQGSFTATETRGYTLFRTRCQSCHTPPLFTNNSFANNGLTIKATDSGRYEVTLRESDLFLFRVPSLRNIAVTAPYMHDGRIRTLNGAIRHYSNMGNNTYYLPTLDAQFRSDSSIGFSMSSEDINALEAFLKTLTDYPFINDPKFRE